MGWIKTLSALLIAASASPDHSKRENMLMNEIEQALVLPAKAQSFSSYSRNYAFSGPDEVTAIYLTPSAYMASIEAAANERRWYPGAASLPSIDDGGCHEVNIRYQLSTRQFLSVTCNNVF